MGLHNRITKKKYDKMKTYSNRCLAIGTTPTSAVDARVSEKFGVSASTARNIRLTGDYQRYCERVFRYHGNPGRRKVRVEAVPLDDHGDNFYATLGLELRISMLAIVVFIMAAIVILIIEVQK